MKTIRISGIIASFEMENESNVTPATLRQSLDDAGNEDLLITINSPGGSVFQGLEMFSMIRNHPGNTETRVVSLAASMGSVLALAGNKKSIEDTALFFIHNAQGVGFGDHRAMAKIAQWLKDVSNLLAELYGKHTTLSITKAKKHMDDEAQFFGKDLESLGFELIETDENITQSTARVQAVARLKECQAKISNEEVLNDLEKVAASIAGDKNETYLAGLESGDTQKGSELNNKTPAVAGEINQEVISMDHMTLDQIMANDPAVKLEVDALLKTERTAGLEQGKAEIQVRIDAAVNFIGNKDYPKIDALAIKVLKGESEPSALEGAVTAYDMLKEQGNSDDAKVEGAKIPETPADANADAPLDDVAAAVAETNKMMGRV